MSEHDVLIVGGGLVGASLAIALDGAGWRVGLVEAAAPRVDAQPSYDERNLALARASVNALDALGVWAEVGARATPIRRLHVSRQGEFGALRLDAAAHGVADFGAVLPARELGNGLLARLARCTSLARYAPAKLSALALREDCVELTLETPDGTRRTSARLLVGADGTHSFVRSALGIGTQTIDYEQVAFVTTLTPERALDSAVERFTASGPLALLPLSERRVGLVLTVPAADAERVAAYDDAAFLALVHERVGWRLGRFAKPGRRAPYPLRRVAAQRLTAPRTVLVGNAAQTIHPIGAQGFNLGLRDALTLSDLLSELRGAGAAAACDAADPAAPELLAEYVRRRTPDRDATMAFSDGLARWTAAEALPLKLLRSLGLLALDRVPPLQQALVRRGMGFRAPIARLALGRDA